MSRVPARGDYRYFDNVARDQELRRLRKKVEEYENGEALVRERKRADKWKARYEREAAARKKDAEKAERERRKTAKIWQDVNADLSEINEDQVRRIRALEAALREKDAAYAALEKAHNDLAAAHQALLHRMTRNHTNSHMPSSGNRPGTSTPKNAKRHNNNSRRQTGRKRGAQPGHPHHPRKKHAPTAEPVIHTTPPREIVGSSDWHLTDEYVERNEVNVVMMVEVIPHRAMIWKNDVTGEKKVSVFPEGLHDETNYSKQTEAVVLMLTHAANIANRKAKQLLYELTDGVLDVSAGWIAGIPAKFAKRCQSEINQIYSDLFHSPNLHVDSTVTKNNGKREAVTVTCSRWAAAVLFTHTKKKGHAAAKTTPCCAGNGYTGTVISDREAAYTKLGRSHQLCLAHLMRDLQDVIDMEKCAWAEEMYALMGEMTKASHAWLDTDAADAGPSDQQVQAWEARYDAILQRGRDHYCSNPPTRHYLDGHNLRKQLADAKEMVLLFLHDTRVPPTNNMAERCLRMHKRALHQAVTFRSAQSIDERCDIDSVIQTARLRDMKIFPLLTSILARSASENDEEPSAFD